VETIFIDTHIVVWLFVKDKEKFTPQTIELIENSELTISPMVIIELGLLYEIKRLNYSPQHIIENLKETISLSISDISFERIALKSTELLWTRDPFDRIITATAMVENTRLLTKDQMILEHYENAVW